MRTHALNVIRGVDRVCRSWNGAPVSRFIGRATTTTLWVMAAAVAVPMSASGQEADRAPATTDPPPAPSRGRPGGPRVAPKADASARGLRDPQGEILFGINGGYTVGNGVQFGSAGVHFGYAALTGVVPGVRANLFFGDVTGGQVVGTLWLTPPFALTVVPFGVGEVGYVWQTIDSESTNGVLYGVGGGLHVGRPYDSLSLRIGAIYRVFNDGDGYFSPLVLASFRL